MVLNRDFPVPMDELRRASTEALLAPLKARADALEEEIAAELTAGLAARGLAIVERARFERVRQRAAGAMLLANTEPDSVEEAAELQTLRLYAFEFAPLEPDDLDPLP